LKIELNLDKLLSQLFVVDKRQTTVVDRNMHWRGCGSQEQNDNITQLHRIACKQSLEALKRKASFTVQPEQVCIQVRHATVRK
jgi:hypothetical protein